MSYRETEINFAIWLYPEKKDVFSFILIYSVVLHVFFAFILENLNNSKDTKEITTTSHQNKPIHIQFTDGKLQSNLPKNKQKEKHLSENIPENIAGGVLTDKNPNSKSKINVPEELAAKNLKANSNPFISKRLPNYKKKEIPPTIVDKSEKNKKSELDKFLPNSDSAYIDNLRKQYKQEQNIEGDSGDIPIMGDEYTPLSEPKVKERYSVKDLSLYQFSQQFKEKFAGIWNSKDRVVPPTSPLRPGDIIYYKLYINGNGSLEKYENLTQKRFPQKDFLAVDKMLDEVVSKVFPLALPGRFANNIVTEIIAIQVVGRNSPVQYSFQ
ncbi:hypothetical protein ACWNT8_11930 [Pigmentibacter ruber]|nr:hypothetical protein GTC16762_16070 [Pigmentibacter ruber]